MFGFLIEVFWSVIGIVVELALFEGFFTYYPESWPLILVAAFLYIVAFVIVLWVHELVLLLVVIVFFHLFLHACEKIMIILTFFHNWGLLHGVNYPCLRHLLLCQRGDNRLLMLLSGLGQNKLFLSNFDVFVDGFRQTTGHFLDVKIDEGWS